MGIRAEESSRRAKRPQIDVYKNGDHIYKPLFYWLEWEIWDYIDRYNLPYCKLYDEGFSRIGCVVCPFICGPKTKKVVWKLQKAKDRWPKIYATFERSLHELYTKSNLPSYRKMRLDNLWRETLGYLKPITWETFRDDWYLAKSNSYNYDPKEWLLKKKLTLF